MRIISIREVHLFHDFIKYFDKTKVDNTEVYSQKFTASLYEATQNEIWQMKWDLVSYNTCSHKMNIITNSAVNGHLVLQNTLLKENYEGKKKRTKTPDPKNTESVL